MSERRACRVIDVDRKSVRYRSTRDDDGALREKLRELANQRWSLDFVHDQMASGGRFRVLNVVDDVTRECLAAAPDTSISPGTVSCASCPG
jgi:putative transposase